MAGLALLSLAGCDRSAAPTAAPAGKPPGIEYLGPQKITGPSSLSARATARSGRIVAVTFLLDGRPLGSDTTRPYALDVDPAFLPHGRHELGVEAVDSLGRRRSAAGGTVEISGSRAHVLTATPRKGLGRALAALRRGNVTVHLGPGRYRLDEARIGSGSRLVGSGPRTVISAPPGRRYWALLVAKGENIRISDLTLDGGGTSSIWWATKNEWLGLIDVADLDLEALYGGFAGEPLGDDDREYVFIARR